LEATRALNRQETILRQAGLALAAAGPSLAVDLEITGRSAAGERAYDLILGQAPARLFLLEQARQVDPRKDGGDPRKDGGDPRKDGGYPRKDGGYPRKYGGFPNEVAYGILDIPQEVEQAAKAVADFSALVRRLVNQYALVETRVAGRRVGLTRLDWTGDMQTWWQWDGDPGQFARHNQLVSQALETRRQWLRLLLLILSGAARIGAALASGPFSLLAIGTIWNYVQEVVKEFQTTPRVTEPPRY
jgi:hypothetical protein